MHKLWYSLDLEGEINTYDSAGEAETAAHEHMICEAEGAARHCWHDNIGELSWGEMVPHAEATLVKRTPPTEGRPDGAQEWALVAVEVEAERPGLALAEAEDRRDAALADYAAANEERKALRKALSALVNAVEDSLDVQEDPQGEAPWDRQDFAGYLDDARAALEDGR